MSIPQSWEDRWDALRVYGYPWAVVDPEGGPCPVDPEDKESWPFDVHPGQGLVIVPLDTVGALPVPEAWEEPQGPQPTTVRGRHAPTYAVESAREQGWRLGYLEGVEAALGALLECWAPASRQGYWRMAYERGAGWVQRLVGWLSAEPGRRPPTFAGAGDVAIVGHPMRRVRELEDSELEGMEDMLAELRSSADEQRG